ncbi:MAG: DUF1559 domain-containing protein [Gemmataceae bacterium]|nr:DUF1559 domain-containing protein [Gemmataceae bacterium]
MTTRANVIVGGLILLTVGGLVIGWSVKSREASTRSQCQNNLKQIGLALQNYNDVHRHLPVGTMRNPTLPPEKRLSWFVSMMPYVQAGGPRLHTNKGWDEKENRVIYAYGMDDGKWIVGEVPVLMCPANPNRTAPPLPGVTHYVGMAGVGEDAAQLPLDDTRCGVFGYERAVRFKDITDGMANTMLVLETLRANGPWTAGGPPTVRGLVPDGSPYLGAEAPFGSLHGRWTHGGFADGSVRAFLPSVAPDLLEALATIAGGEKVGELPGA